MGLFDFWAKKAETVNFSELNEWLNKQVAGKRLEQKVAFAKQEIAGMIMQCRQSLETLEQAQLMNENIPIKEKQIMEGHRRMYAQRMRRFLDDIYLPDDFSKAGHASARFSETLSQLSEETGRNHLVLKQFFDRETTRTAQGVNLIGQALAKLQSDIDKEGVENIKEVKIRLSQFHEDMNKKAKLEQELEMHNQDMDILQKKKEKIGARLNELKKSPDYEEFKALLEEKKKCEDDVNAIEQELIAIFAELNRPLKKYTHNSISEKLVDKYIADPVGALEDDSNLAMHEILKRMVIEMDTLELKEKQLEKAKEMITKLTSEFLLDKKRSLSMLKSQNKEFATKINRSVIALNIAENESWLRSLDSKTKESETRIAKTIHEIEQLNPSYLKQKVKEKVKEVNPEIKIIDEA